MKKHVRGKDVNIEVLHSEESKIVDQLVDGVREFNFSHMGNETSKPLTVIMRDSNNTIVAGISGRTIYHKFLINVVWVSDEYRGQRLGYQLMKLAEQEAKQQGCKAAQVDTLAFQAPNFYQKCGFEVIGTAPGFDGCPEQYFLFKRYE